MHAPLHSSLNGGRTGIEIMGNIDRELAFSIPEYRRRVEGIRSGMTRMGAVSYTHLTLPTSDLV